LWADCAPTTVLIQSDQRLPLPHIDNTTQSPVPGTWLHSLLHQLLNRQPELSTIALPHHTQEFPCIDDTTSFLQLNAFPHGQCYDPHISPKPTSVTVSLSTTAYLLAIHSQSILIGLPATETRRGLTVPKQATLSIRPAHCSIFGHAQSPNPIFTGRYSSVDQAEAAFYV
jgi:hypothetical protein